MIIAQSLLLLLFGFITLLSSLALLRAKDMFLMPQIIKIYGFYGMPILFIAIMVKNFNITTALITLIIIIFNILFTILLCNIIIRSALNKNIKPDADKM